MKLGLTRVGLLVEFESNWVPHSHSLVLYMFSDESNRLEKYTYVRNKKINYTLKIQISSWTNSV